MFDIVILTDSRYVNPSKKNWYINQVILEDQLLETALEGSVLLLFNQSFRKNYWGRCGLECIPAQS